MQIAKFNASTVSGNGAANTILDSAFGPVVTLYYVSNSDTIPDLTDGEVVIHVGGGGTGGGAGALAGHGPGTGVAELFFLQPPALAVGGQHSVLARTPRVTNEMAADLAARAARNSRPFGASALADQAWSAHWHLYPSRD